MTRLLLLLLPTLAFLSAMLPEPPPPAPIRPNLVFILADDLGYGDVGCYGQTKIKTPNLDRMAQQGMRFTDFYTGSTVCAPSRCALMTGQHTGHTYVRGNKDLSLRPQDLILPEQLKKAGYTTAMFGKWGLGNPGTTGEPNRKGWDIFYGQPDQTDAHFQQPDTLWRIENGKTVAVRQPKGQYANETFTREALGFLRQAHKSPFFLYLPYTVPHAELHVPDRYLSRYRTPQGNSLFEPEKPWPDGQHYGGQPMPKAAYAAMVSSIDDYVGQVLAELKKQGLDKNTLVIFASDNGTHVEGGRRMDDVAFFRSSGPLRGIKRDMYDGGIRTPFVAYWPGRIAPNQTSNWMGAFWDIPATFLQLANAPALPATDGISFVPTLLGQQNQAQHQALYWEFFERGFDQAIRSGSWKAVRQQRLGGQIELYNLSTDPGETQNVAAQNPNVVAQLEKRMAASRTESAEFTIPAKR